MTLAEPIEIVSEFLSDWDRPGGIDDAIRTWFAADTIWENVGMSRTSGPEEALAFMVAFGQGKPVTMRVDVLSIAAVGDKVLTERIDHVLGEDGSPAMSIRLMGIFEVIGGKIAAWRDYFDTAGFGAQS